MERARLLPNKPHSMKLEVFLSPRSRCWRCSPLPKSKSSSALVGNAPWTPRGVPWSAIPVWPIRAGKPAPPLVDVRFGSLADICGVPTHVRFTPLWAKSGVCTLPAPANRRGGDSYFKMRPSQSGCAYFKRITPRESLYSDGWHRSLYSKSRFSCSVIRKSGAWVHPCHRLSKLSRIIF